MEKLMFSRKKIYLGIIYLLFFSLCLGFFYIRAKLNDYYIFAQAQLERQLDRYNLYSEKIEFNLWSQSLSISNISHKNTENIIFSKIYVNLGLWNKTIEFEINPLQGAIAGNIKLDSYFSLQNLSTSMDWNSVELKPFFQIAAKNLVLPIQFEQGSVSGSFSGTIPYNKNISSALKAGQGTLSCKLENIDVTHSIPMLKVPQLNNIMGDIKVNWDKNNFDSNIKIQNAEFEIFESGRLIMQSNFRQSDLDININVTIDEDKLYTSLVPKRTLNAIQKDGLVKMHISNKVSSPHIKILAD